MAKTKPARVPRYSSTATGGPTYTALGGSNTCGHGLRFAAKDAFQRLVLQGLKEQAVVTQLQPACIPAMGPDYPASCINYFAPNTTAYATLEFTPNMGDKRELEDNAAHLEQLANNLIRRGVRTAFVSLVPRPPTCDKCIANFEAAHASVRGIAERTRLPLVTMKYENTTWSDDLKHLNEKGHRGVAERVLAAFARADSIGRATHLKGADPQRELPSCTYGNDLMPLVLPGSRGFVLGNAGRHMDKPGLVATQPGAQLRLCLRRMPPSFGVSLAFERSDHLPMSNVSLACEAGCLCPHQRLSNGDWTLKYLGKGSRRATENHMHRVLGSRQVGQVDGSDPAAAAAGCDCVLRLRNTQDAADANARAKINGLVAGSVSMIGWANRFHMGLNPYVLSG